MAEQYPKYPPKDRTKFSRDKWEAAFRLFLSGKGYRAVSKECGIPYGTLAAWGGPSKSGWVERRAKLHSMRLLADDRQQLVLMEVNQETKLAARKKYAAVASAIANKIAEEVLALGNRPASPRRLLTLANALRKCEEVEFAALGMASSKVEVEGGQPITFQEFIARTRRERGLEAEVVEYEPTG